MRYISTIIYLCLVLRTSTIFSIVSVWGVSPLSLHHSASTIQCHSCCRHFPPHPSLVYFFGFSFVLPLVQVLLLPPTSWRYMISSLLVLRVLKKSVYKKKKK